jgi:hypothetical protein
MNKQQVWFEAKSRNFQETPNGVQWEAVIFSSEFNRNQSYFDIYKLKRWRDKLSKVMMNNNHDGKYFSAVTDKITAIDVRTDERGITECFATVQSTNSEKRANPEKVTGFSIELMVDTKDVIANENGEYYIDYEWVGMAYLLSEMAGSGDTRLLSMKTFNQKNQTNFMSDSQSQAMIDLLSQQNQTLNLILQELVKDNQMDSVETQAFSVEEEAVVATPTEEVTTPEVAEEPVKVIAEVTPEEIPAELKQIESNLNHAEKLKVQMSLNKEEELVSDQSGAGKTAKSASEALFELNKSISQSIKL